MKRIFVIFIMLVLGKSVFPQSYDSLCNVPVMMIKDTSIFKVIDTLFFLEQQSGADLSYNDKIAITFIDTDGSCMIHLVKDSSLELTILSSMVEYVRIAYYRNLNIILMSGIIPNEKIITASNDRKQVRCVSYSGNEVLYEDYANIEEEPNYCILAKKKDGHMHIHMIVNREGEIIYDSSGEARFPFERISDKGRF